MLLELQSKHFNVISINLDFVEAFRVAFFSRKFSSKQMAGEGWQGVRVYRDRKPGQR